MFKSSQTINRTFGLDSAATYDLVVSFPSGSEVKVADVKTGQTVTVEESQTVAEK